MTELETQAKEHKTELRLISLTTVVTIIVISLKLIMMTTAVSKAEETIFNEPNMTSAKTDIEYLNQYAQSQNPPPRNDGNRRPGPPPKEAIEICKSQSENASCTFTDKRHKREITGTCELIRNNTIACVPKNHRPPKRS